MTEGNETLQRRIVTILRSRNAMHMDELCMRLGVDRTAAQGVLEAMMASGEIERLRPIAYTREDHDFFRVNGPASVVVMSGDRYISQTVCEREQEAQLTGEAMACFADQRTSSMVLTAV